MLQHLCLGSCPPALESVNSAHSVFKPTMSAGAQLHTGKLDLDQHVWIHGEKTDNFIQILSFEYQEGKPSLYLCFE